MINKINLAGLGPYYEDSCCLDDLDKVNYIYGANGAGKTTISEYLRSGIKDDDTRVDWDSDAHNQVLVYNQHYVDTYFQKDEIPGVFTLGEENIETKKHLEDIRAQIDGLVASKASNLSSLDAVKEKHQTARTTFENSCWDLKRRLSDGQKEAFRGCLSKKSAFANRLEATDIPQGFEADSEATLEELAKKASKPSLPKLELLEIIDLEELRRAESDSTLIKPLVGSNDIGISSLISELNNAGWVESGLKYYSKTGNSICPFCQQPTPKALADVIESYFDASYREGKENLTRSAEAFKASLDWCRRLREGFSIYEEQNIQIDDVANCLIEFEALASKSLDLLKAKLLDTGRSIELQNTEDARSALIAAIEKTNSEIAAHNEQAANLGEFKQETYSRIRTNYANRAVSAIKSYKKERKAFEKARSSLMSKISDIDKKISSLESERKNLLSSLSSSVPTIQQINEMLASLAFNNFALTDANGGKDYRIVRPDGSGASNTLSEGEKTFITFLYFLSYVKSVADSHPIVVIDDPISSLDSSVLFFVSSMVRDEADKVRDKSIRGVSQLLVLTHNASFHHEITFASKGYSLSSSHFYVIRKVARGSMVEAHGANNPVATGYEALWRELNGEQRSISTRNTIRRIIETYFNFVGGLKLDAVFERLSPADQPLGRSLLLWIHSGSHILSEDAECLDSPDDTKHYLRVFYLIFESNGHSEHFKYMAEKTGLSLDGIIPEIANDPNKSA